MQWLLHHKESNQLLELAGIVNSNFHILIVLFFWLKEHISPSFPSLPAASETDEMQGSKEHSPCNVPTSFEEAILCDLLLCLPRGYQITPSAFVSRKEIPLYSLKNPKVGIQKTSSIQLAVVCSALLVGQKSIAFQDSPSFPTMYRVYVDLLLLDMLMFDVDIGTSSIQRYIQKKQKHSLKGQKDNSSLQ